MFKKIRDKILTKIDKLFPFGIDGFDGFVFVLTFIATMIILRYINF